MQQSSELSQNSVNMAQENGEALEGIREQVATLADLNRSVAAAIEEQSMVAGQVSQNVEMIMQLATESESFGTLSHQLSVDLLEKVKQQTSLVSQFR